MKKIILAIAALALLASPAMALDWDFYGSARIQTSYHWFEQKDATNNVFTTGALPFSTQAGDTVANFSQDDKDDGLFWDTLLTSRFGARVKGDPVQGRIEYNNAVSNRLLWGQWKINSALRLRVGQDWRPLNYFYSGQQHNDTGMAGPDGAGGVITHRDPQLKLIIGEGQNLHIAFVDGDSLSGGAGDVDITIPIIEANYHFAADMFFFDVGGIYWTYEVEGDGTAASPDDDVSAYALALGGGVNLGPAYIKANGYWGMNLSELGWVTNHLGGGLNAATLAANSYSDSAPVADAGGNFDDTDSWGVLGVVGMRFTDMIAAELGAGWESHDTDVDGAKKDETFAIYGHLNYTAAPGVSIIPEIGYIDLQDNIAGNEEGTKTYVSIKWQVDF